jgi:hypothetical protein
LIYFKKKKIKIKEKEEKIRKRDEDEDEEGDNFHNNLNNNLNNNEIEVIYHVTKVNLENLINSKQIEIKSNKADDPFYDKILTDKEAPQGIFFSLTKIKYNEKISLPKFSVYPRGKKFYNKL